MTKAHHNNYLSDLPEDQVQEQDESSTNFKISNKFKGIMAMQTIGNDLIVVENVWKKLLKRMIMPLNVPKFGN